MDKTINTYKCIADILSYEISIPNLENRLTNPNMNWDNLVIEGSKHLVLPTIYCRLKAKKLLHVLPIELTSYLKEITDINRNRNEKIIEQTKSISRLLTKHSINHVFLKGTALLALGCFKDIGERMVGDIDILVSKSQLLQAFELLKKNGYDKTHGFAYDNKDFRHLDRLISKHKIAAIELHSELLNKPHRHLINLQQLLINKVVTNNITTPSEYYLAHHAILGMQINNNSFYYKSVNFKTIYDCVTIKSHTHEILISDLLLLKEGQTFLELAKLYFKEFNNIYSTKTMESYRSKHKKYLKNPVFRYVLKPIKHAYLYTKKRVFLVSTNKSYVEHLLKSIFIRKK